MYTDVCVRNEFWPFLLKQHFSGLKNDTWWHWWTMNNEKETSSWGDTITFECSVQMPPSSGQVFGGDLTWNQCAANREEDGISLADMPGTSPFVSLLPPFCSVIVQRRASICHLWDVSLACPVYTPRSVLLSQEAEQLLAQETATFPLCLRPQTAVAPKPSTRRGPLCEQCTCVWARVSVGMVMKTLYSLNMFSHRDHFVPSSGPVRLSANPLTNSQPQG